MSDNREPPVGAETSVEQALVAASSTHAERCPEQALLRRLVRRALPEDEAARVSEHAALCSRCRAVYADLERAQAIARNLDRSAEVSAARRPAMPRLSWAIAAAAVLVLAVIGRVAFLPAAGTAQISVGMLGPKGPGDAGYDIGLRVEGARGDGAVAVRPPPTFVWNRSRVPAGHRVGLTVVDLKTFAKKSEVVPNSGRWQAPGEWFQPGRQYRVNWRLESAPVNGP